MLGGPGEEASMDEGRGCGEVAKTDSGWMVGPSGRGLLSWFLLLIRKPRRSGKCQQFRPQSAGIQGQAQDGSANLPAPPLPKHILPGWEGYCI